MSHPFPAGVSRVLLPLAVVATLASCSATGTSNVAAQTAFDPAFTPAWAHTTERMRLEPLRPAVAKLDYDGFMSSIDHLRATLRWGNWPSPDFQLEQNEKDLQRHWDEFGTGVAYAYTVLAPDRSRCLGCVYVNPDESDPRAASVAYWVTADMLASGFDRHLVEELLTWFERDWPLDRVVFPTHVANARGVLIAEELGLVAPAAEGEAERLAYTWKR
jgi:RimJ/RimL family protein N-acetyltransferase